MLNLSKYSSKGLTLKITPFLGCNQILFISQLNETLPGLKLVWIFIGLNQE